LIDALRDSLGELHELRRFDRLELEVVEDVADPPHPAYIGNHVRSEEDVRVVRRPGCGQLVDRVERAYVACAAEMLLLEEQSETATETEAPRAFEPPIELEDNGVEPVGHPAAVASARRPAKMPSLTCIAVSRSRLSPFASSRNVSTGEA